MLNRFSTLLPLAALLICLEALPAASAGISPAARLAEIQERLSSSKSLVAKHPASLEAVTQTEALLKSDLPVESKIRLAAERLNKLISDFGHINVPYFGENAPISMVLDAVVRSARRAASELPAVQAAPKPATSQAQPSAAPSAEDERTRLHRISKLIEHDAASSFDIFNANPDTPLADITRTYRTLSQRWHPDRATGDDGATFKIINDAYTRVFKDKDARNYEIGLFRRTDRP